MTQYWRLQAVRDIPRLPLEGGLDPTYRCNNNCRHCWIRSPAGSPGKQEELSLDEIKILVDEARKMGCRRWSISGGEPMLRSDFEELFDYVTRKSASYSLNTNGTLINPAIARLMKRKGFKMVALYGATASVHDHVTRNAGSFEALMRGIAYLKEAGAAFIVQIIPLRDNYHQYKEMTRLAESLSRRWRIGAPWLYLSADGDYLRNQEITRQRLSPGDALHLDEPDLPYEEAMERSDTHSFFGKDESNCLFSACIARGQSFHVDPYGKMTFCPYIVDPDLRYDLRTGSFAEGWEQFIPSLADKIQGTSEYAENCGSCENRKDCRWCPVYAYLEHRRFSAKVEYLCSMAKESRQFKMDWEKSRRRYYRIAGITLQVDSDLPITETTFDSKFRLFEVDGPGEDTIFIRHHFSLPDPGSLDWGKEVYREPPWAIFKKGDSWIYVCIAAEGNDAIYKVAVFSHDHTHARIYSAEKESFLKGGLHSLTLFPTDQILLARVLADREGCYVHSSGVSMDGEGLLFVGHSGAGKSTMVTMLKNHAEILCDDRMIVRFRPDGFQISGTWSHGDVAQVSAASAPLKALFFLEKADRNYLEPIGDVKAILKRLLPCMIKPFVTASWWDKMLSLAHRMAREVPCYVLHFDQSGKVVELLRHM